MLLAEKDKSLIAVYGILKNGYCVSLDTMGGEQLGIARLDNAVLYSINKGVGLRFEDPKRVGAEPALVEVWEIPDTLWRRLDMMESNGFCYTRKEIPMRVQLVNGEEDVEALVWVYEHTFPEMKYDNPILNGVY